MNFLYNWFRFGYIKTKRYLRKTKRWNDENATISESKYPEPNANTVIFTSIGMSNPSLAMIEATNKMIDNAAKECTRRTNLQLEEIRNESERTKRKVPNRRKSKPDRSRKRSTKKSKSPR